MPEGTEPAEVISSVRTMQEWYRKDFVLMISMFIFMLLTGFAQIFVKTISYCTQDMQIGVIKTLASSLNERLITLQTYVLGFWPSVILIAVFILTTYLYVFKEHGEIKIFGIQILNHAQILFLCMLGAKTWWIATYLFSAFFGGCKLL